MIPLRKIGDLHFSPKDLVALVRDPLTLAKMASDELWSMKEAIDFELNYREDKEKKHARPS